MILYIIYVYSHLFFIHSSTDGDLDGWHILAIADIAAVSVGVEIRFQISVFIFGEWGMGRKEEGE